MSSKVWVVAMVVPAWQVSMCPNHRAWNSTQHLLTSTLKLKRHRADFSSNAPLPQIREQTVHMPVRLRVGSLERINPDFFGAHPNQFQNGITMKRRIESVAVRKEKMPTEHKIKASILKR